MVLKNMDRRVYSHGLHSESKRSQVFHSIFDIYFDSDYIIKKPIIFVTTFNPHVFFNLLDNSKLISIQKWVSSD